MKLLLLGRTRRRRARGGIHRSARLITECLQSVGDEVELRDAGSPPAELPAGTDLVLLYGDLDTVEERIRLCLRAGVPIVVNGGYDARADRSRRLVELLRSWDPGGSGLVFLSVFSTEAEHDPELREVREQVVALPKTIRVPVHRSWKRARRPFSERAGICVGELAKLARPRLVAGMGVPAALGRLAEALPGVELLAYDQYGTLDTPVPAGVTVVPYDAGGFLDWLASRRLLVSLSRHETFAMVPAEAQGVGTPVLYRHMPQSLSPHLGHTGYTFADVDELVLGARRLYHDERLWEQLSEAGRHNAVGRSVSLQGASLHLALSKVLLRAGRAQRAPDLEASPRFVVVVRAYDRPAALADLLRDLEREGRGQQVMVLVYDDASPGDMSEPRRVAERNGWRWTVAADNHGKRRAWLWTSRVLSECRAWCAGDPLFVFLDDDMRLCRRFFERMSAAWEGIDDPGKATLHLMVDAGREHAACWTGVLPERVSEEVWRTQWVDGAFVCDRSVFEALDWRVPEVPESRWDEDPGLSTGGGWSMSRRLHGQGRSLYRVHRSLVAHRVGPSRLNEQARRQAPMTGVRFVDGPDAHRRLLTTEPVYASLATIPGREESLAAAMESLRPQVDVLRVFLNGHEEVPACLDGAGDSVEVLRSQEHGDRGDAGKLAWSEGATGYQLTCDDDLVYPRDYVLTLVAAIERYGRRAVVGVHGALLPDELRSYYRSRTVLHFRGALEEDRPVHLLGTGCLAYHASALRVRPSDFELPNMADVWFGLLCQRQGVPCVSVARPEGWLRPLTTEGSIYEAARDDDRVQTEVLRRVWPWKLYVPRGGRASADAGERAGRLGTGAGDAGPQAELRGLRGWYDGRAQTFVGEAAWEGDRAISVPGARFILSKLDELQPETIADVGSGYSSLFLRRWTAGRSATCCSVDHDEGWLGFVQGLAGELGLCTERFVTMERFRDMARPGSFDVLVVDHGPELQTRLDDIAWLVTLLRPGGCLLFDDWRPRFARRATARLAELGFVTEAAEQTRRWPRDKAVGVAVAKG